MADPNTLRILELDGGGERGYLSLNFLIKFIQQWGISPSAIAQNFDVICGTSIGGILSLALAFGKTPDELSPFFTTDGPLLFSTNGTPSNRASTANKVLAFAPSGGGLNPYSGIPFYSTQGTEYTYGSNLLVNKLDNMFTTNTMQNLLTNVVIPTYKVTLRNDLTLSSGTYTLCSNVTIPGFVAQNELIKNVALATSAAPFYLPSLSVTAANPNDSSYLNGRYIDGGVYANNPASFGWNLAQILKPTARRCCILSIATGLGEMGFDDPSSPSPMLVNQDPLLTVENLFALFDVASTGGQESVAKSLLLESKYTLNKLYYYRFQPVLDPTKDTELDNTDAEILTYYETVANDWFNSDIDNINTFIGHLNA